MPKQPLTPTLSPRRAGRGRRSSASALERTVDRGLRLALDLPEMILAAETFRVDLVDLLGARGPCGEPAVVGDHLDAAEGLPVAGRRRERGADRLAGEFLERELFAGQRLQLVLLRHCGRRIDPLVI